MPDAKLQENIDTYGWQFQYVFDPDGEGVDFGYSIGFEATWGHPEVMIFGLPQKTMHGILTDLAHAIEQGRTFVPNVRTPDVIGGGYDVIFKPLPEVWHPEYAGIAVRYYQRPFRVYLLLWPDKHNVLPTEPGCRDTAQAEALGLL